MKRPHLIVLLMAGLTMLVATDVQPVAAEPARVPIRSAITRTTQLDLNASPVPVPLSPTPTPAEPIPDLPPSAGSPLPPQPIPDQPIPNQPVPNNQPSPPPSGGAMYRGPLGADFQRDNLPKKVYLGDEHGPGSKPLLNGPGVVGNPGTMGVTDPYGIAPPRGTLGQTYQRRSRQIDDEKHPRMAAVDVHLSENYDVSAKGLKAKWTGKEWHLSIDTLLPGIPHIYEVKVEWGPEGAKQQEIRTIRLIMNRVVDLEF